MSQMDKINEQYTFINVYSLNSTLIAITNKVEVYDQCWAEVLVTSCSELVPRQKIWTDLDRNRLNFTIYLH